MYFKFRARRAVLVAATTTYLALGLGVADLVHADDSVPPADPVLTESAPPGEDPGAESDDEATEEPTPETSAPETTEPAEEEPASSEPEPAPEITAPVEAEPVTTEPVEDEPETPAPPAPSKTPSAPSNAVATPVTTEALAEQDAVAEEAALVVSKPTAPRSPKVTPGNASVALSWVAPLSNGGAPIDRYVVQISTNGTSWTALPPVGGTSYTKTGLKNGTRYYFRVFAHNLAGYGAASTAVSAVPRTVPSAPQSLAAAPGANSVSLYWAKPASAGGAAIDRYEVRIWNGTNWTIKSTTATSFKVTGLINGKQYAFRIRAHNAAGFSPFSTQVSAVPRTKPSAPRSPKAIAANTSVKVTWDPPLSNGGAKIDAYAVQWSTDGKSWSSKNTAATATSYTVLGLKNGVQYRFRILAHNPAGWSVPSTTVLATPHTTVPSAPLSVAATPGKSSVTVSWKQPTNGGSAILGYKIELSYDGDKWADQASLSAAALSHPINNMVPGTKYYLRVRARNALGWSAPSATVHAIPYTTPSAPASCTASKFGQQSINMSWTAPSNKGFSPIVNYFTKLYAVDPVDQSETLVGFQILSANETFTLETGLNLAYSYVVRVSAVDAAGEGSYCEVYVP